MSEIRNCNYNCENSAGPQGTGGEAGPADTGTQGTQRHLSRQIDNCNLLISVHRLLSNLLSKNSIFLRFNIYELCIFFIITLYNA